jgi:hypothetical protein
MGRLQGEVRSLSMSAQAMLAVAAAGRVRSTARPSQSRDSPLPGATPANCPAAPAISRAARGYGWLRWRCRHVARARWSHYHARLKAAQGHLTSGRQKRSLM